MLTNFLVTIRSLGRAEVTERKVVDPSEYFFEFWIIFNGLFLSILGLFQHFRLRPKSSLAEIRVDCLIEC